VPILGRDLWDACRTFCDHLNPVLARTVTQTRLVPIGRPGLSRQLQVAFRGGGGRLPAARLRTRFGPMALYIGQLCETVPVGGQHQLVTVEYRYTLTPGELEEAAGREPLLRWEYVREPGGDARWCRHHLQGPIRLDVGRQSVMLNDWHLPTGYVTVEEVLRFCIVDLGVEPLAPDWHEILERSYRRFKHDFAPRGLA